MQIIDHRNIAGAVSSRGENGARANFGEKLLSGPELIQNRRPAIDPVLCFTLSSIGNGHDRPELAADFRGRLRAPAEIFKAARALPLRVGQNQLEGFGILQCSISPKNWTVLKSSFEHNAKPHAWNATARLAAQPAIL